jgi:3-carboxy-cis,cis-muconate cycloisomerase
VTQPAPAPGTADGLFGGIFARGGAAVQVTDAAWLQAMLDAEAALARACAVAGLIPAGAAEEIAAACRAEHFDVAALGSAAAAHAQPVVGLVAALREAVSPEVAEYVHLGATSQDILDSAAMLVARRALEPLLEDARAAAAACAALAERHSATPVLGRTLLQPAVPTTFGVKAATWLVGLDEARVSLARVRDDVLAVQLGGPVGDLARYGDDAAAVSAAFAAELALVEPTLPWHAIRRRPAEVAAALGVLAGVLAKIARDVTLLAQGEVAEARESGGPGRGGSSSMPHKRNPVAAVSAAACTGRVPGLVATMLSAMGQEHERAAGGWQAEWETWSDLLRLTGAGAAWGREMLEGLEVDTDRMRANLDAAGSTGRADAGDAAAARALVDRALAAHRAVQA